MPGFSVTHIPSGMSVVQSRKEDEAKKIITFLEQRQDHWNFRSPKRLSIKVRQDYEQIMRGEYETVSDKK